MSTVSGTVTHGILFGAAYDPPRMGTYGSPLIVTSTGVIASRYEHAVASDSSYPNAVLLNSGTITVSPVFGRYAVALYGDGTIVNSGLIQGFVFLYLAGTVTNSGTMDGSIRIFGGGEIYNSSSGRMVGVSIEHGAGTVFNSGTIARSDFYNGSVTVEDFGIVDNDGGLIQGVASVGSGTITNTGTIAGVGIGSGRLDNTGGLITFGVSIDGTVTNSGTIAGTYYDGLFLTADSTVENTGLIDGYDAGVLFEAGGGIANSGVVQGFDGILAESAAVTVTNSGTIFGSGISTYGTQSSGGTAVSLRAGDKVVNDGSLLPRIGGYRYGIDIINAAGTILNSGTIVATGTSSFGTGIHLGGGGYVGNGAIGSYAGFIAGNRYGVDIVNAPGTIINIGGSKILATGSSGVGIHFGAGGYVRNTTGGLIQSGGGGDAIYMSGGGAVSNSGEIIGSRYGVWLPQGGTIIDDSDISGGIAAIVFGGGGSNQLELQHGYFLTGSVWGGVGSSDTLVLSGRFGVPLTVNYNRLQLTSFEEVLFDPGSFATLTVENFGTLGIPIAGFDHPGAIVDLAYIGADGTITNSDTLTDQITVSGSVGSLTLQFDSIDGLPFITSGDGGRGTDLSVACFCRSTLILTEAGEVAVEDLAAGDRVVTRLGEARTIRWIGRRAYDGRFVAENKAVLPIRIDAGALADGVPARDLWVSPEHSLYFDGLLAQAAHLVNGLTIVQAESVERVEYFHIELDTHDILIADGAPAESYIDCDNRLMFENGADFVVLFPNDDRPRWQFCLPRLEHGSAELKEIRAALLARAEHLGYSLDTEPDLHLLVGGTVLRPEAVGNDEYRFAVPAGADTVLLASRSVVPAEIATGIGDVRRLGVAISGLLLHDSDLRIEAAHSHAALNKGFHPNEETHRWTDGLAQIPPSWISCFVGAFTLEVRLASRDLVYPVPPKDACAAA